MSASRNARCIFLCNISIQTAIILASFQQVVSQTPLPLPANPATDCGLEVTRQWSREYPQCMQSILGNSLIYNEPLVDPGTRHCTQHRTRAITSFLSRIVNDHTQGVRCISLCLLADEGCCRGSQKYFGSESTLPSRNCFCDPDVHARFMLGATPVDVVTAFGIC